MTGDSCCCLVSMLLIIAGGCAMGLGCDPDLPGTCGSKRFSIGTVLRIQYTSSVNRKGSFVYAQAFVIDRSSNTTCYVGLGMYPNEPDAVRASEWLVTTNLQFFVDDGTCLPARASERRVATHVGIALLSTSVVTCVLSVIPPPKQWQPPVLPVFKTRDRIPKNLQLRFTWVHACVAQQ
jgi:hypothetical protein